MARINLFSATSFLLLTANANVFAKDVTTQTIPEEYLTTGEQSTALANGGSLSSAGYSSVRANPAMIAVDRMYTMGGGYHWPAKGRQFYEGGVVDGKTASVAAGLVYTSSMDEYEGAWRDQEKPEMGDTPVKRRASLALAYTFKTVAFGVSGGFVETADPNKSFDKEAERIKGYTAGVGMMAGITPSLRAGLSVENLGNKKISYAAPTIYRAGLAWAAVKDFNVYFDLRQREAIELFEGSAPSLGLFESESTSTKKASAEQAMSVGGMARIYDLLRFSLATGVSQTGRESAVTGAGGIALVNKSMSLSYSVQKPDLKISEMHHAVSLGLDVAL